MASGFSLRLDLNALWPRTPSPDPAARPRRPRPWPRITFSFEDISTPGHMSYVDQGDPRGHEIDLGSTIPLLRPCDALDHLLSRFHFALDRFPRRLRRLLGDDLADFAE